MATSVLFKVNYHGPYFGGSSEPFDVGEHFRAPRFNPFPIYEIGSHFQEWYCSMILPPEQKGYMLSVHKFACDLGEEKILSGLSEPKLEISLRSVWDLLCKYQDGETEILGDDGTPNIFFCRAHNGDLTLACFRSRFRHGWSFRAYNKEVRHCRKWRENGRILVPSYD